MKCSKCTLPKDCEDCPVPSNVELGQLLFSTNIVHRYNCPEWIIALLRDLDRTLQIVMYNMTQQPYDSPFENTGNSFICDVFEVHAYSWDDDTEQSFNFKYQDIEINWYKYLGRGTTINGIYNSEKIIEMYNKCLSKILEMEDEYEDC